MNSSIAVVSYETNKVLFSHVLNIQSELNCKIYGMPRRHIIDYFIKVRVSLDVLNSETIFVYNTSPRNLLVIVLGRLRNKKIIFHLHDPIPHSGILNPVLFVLNWLCFKFSNQVIVFDANLLLDMKFYGNSKTLKEKVRVSTHGMPTFQKLPVQWNSSRKRIGFFGRQMPYKNIESFFDLVRRNIAYDFLLVGEGYEVPDDIENRENFKYYSGYIGNDQYYTLMSECHAIWMPYKKVSFSGVLSDAISLGKSVFASDIVCRRFAQKGVYNLEDIDSLIQENKQSDTLSLGWKTYVENLIKIVDEL